MSGTIFPYPMLAGQLWLNVLKVRLDTVEVRIDPELKDLHIIHLCDVHIDDWSKATFQLEATAQKPTLEKFEKAHGPVSLTAVASCGPTNVRETLYLERSKNNSHQWFGEVSLHRDNYRDRVLVSAVLTATVGNVPHRPVKTSARWRVYFDPPSSFCLSGALPVRWCNFRSESAPVLAASFRDAPYVIDLEPSLPEVLLNSSFEGLEALLRDRKDRSPIETALHDMERMGIARSVWMALLADAMASIEIGEDDAEPCMPTDREWKEEVLRRILPEIDKNASEQELLRLACHEWRTTPGSASFLSRAEAVIGEEIIKSNKSLQKSLRHMMRQGIFE